MKTHFGFHSCFVIKKLAKSDCLARITDNLYFVRYFLFGLHTEVRVKLWRLKACLKISKNICFAQLLIVWIDMIDFRLIIRFAAQDTRFEALPLALYVAVLVHFS